MMKNLVLIKLGGSLITDKDKPSTPRKKKIHSLALEIKKALDGNSDLQIILGHGSGSFGHAAAKRHNTQNGVKSLIEWHGFVDVWSKARELNQIVIEQFLRAGLPVISFPPSAAVITQNKHIISWDTAPIESALNSNIIPVIYGDVIFDRSMGGTILSTESLFLHIISKFSPCKVLLAGIESGVWKNYSAKKGLIHEITPKNYPTVTPYLEGSKSVDVTGGMSDKVKTMLSILSTAPHLETIIFSGEKSNNLFKALSGQKPGTVIHA